MRLWCPKMLLTVLVMKLRAFSRSWSVRVSALGSSASASAVACGCTASLDRAGAARGGAAFLATASMQLRDSNSDNGFSMSPAGTKAARSLPLRRPSTSTSTRRASDVSPSERVCISCWPWEVLAKTVEKEELDRSNMAKGGVCRGAVLLMHLSHRVSYFYDFGIRDFTEKGQSTVFIEWHDKLVFSLEPEDLLRRN